MAYYNHINVHSGPEGNNVPRLRWDDFLVRFSRENIRLHDRVLIAHVSAQDKLASTLKPLQRLTHLRIVIHAAVLVYKDAASPYAPPEEYAHTLRGSTLDFDGTAASLVRLFPSLRCFFLTTCGVLSTWDDSKRYYKWPMKPYERWYVPRAWPSQRRAP
uniref:Ubiquitin-conjugating enzyme E2 2 n=1 Tax=Ganoderma boninense TaxID=34458 RepID=A0A5K1JUB3_9APHY|nr:Ubiquitin-conjugating enzyme E2 2 [Ganoderma boninense]